VKGGNGVAMMLTASGCSQGPQAYETFHPPFAAKLAIHQQFQLWMMVGHWWCLGRIGRKPPYLGEI
jgi:hypothetical protein